jgi:hypothetical protein
MRIRWLLVGLTALALVVGGAWEWSRMHARGYS